jgi:hypothetical protein
MGKRSAFDRIPQDRYLTTDPEPVRRLQPHILRGVRFIEPCAGRGDLIESMEWFGHRCVYAVDIKPGNRAIERGDALALSSKQLRKYYAEMFVSNLPWSRDLLHPLIDHLSAILPLWTLLDADWCHTRQAAPYLARCSHIVSVGRVRWIEASSSAGKDNVAWYCFNRELTGGPRFVGLT